MIVYAALITAPSFTKNKEGKQDPEMHQRAPRKILKIPSHSLELGKGQQVIDFSQFAHFFGNGGPQFFNALARLARGF
jgi:hypothetical protein